MEINGKRLYQTPSGSKVASVTTILSQTKSQESIDALNNWRNRVGHQAAAATTKEAAGVGTRMHKMLEEHILGTSTPPGTNLVHQQAHSMAQQIIQKGLSKASAIWGVEVPVYYPELYAGTTDSVGVWTNKETIIDYKQTNRPKKREYIDDYFLQLAGYSAAHNEVYGSNIRQGVILMCSRACEYQEFVLEGSEFDKYTNLWWNRVERYYRENDK